MPRRYARYSRYSDDAMDALDEGEEYTPVSQPATNGAGYGIGRVPADVDAASEALAQVEAGDIMAAMLAHAPGHSALIECPNCGIPTYRSQLMSASRGTACPACYDDLSE